MTSHRWFNRLIRHAVSYADSMDQPREFDVVLEPQPENGYTVYAPDLPGCVSEGGSKDHALANIQEAIPAYLESLDAHGDPLPPTAVRVRVTVGP